MQILMSRSLLKGAQCCTKRQMVEIAKALRMNSKVIIFDEPSAVLTDVEVEKTIYRNSQFKTAKNSNLLYFTSHG